MPADQRNYGYADYLGDDAVHYCVRADSNWIADAGSGGAACTNAIAYGRDTSRRHKRKATFIDLTTGRSVTEPVFTPTAFAALVVGTSTLAVHVPGETATATYTLARLDPEKRPSTVLQSSRVDHA